MDKEVIDKAIAEAVEDAKKDGIHGKATTPYLLAKIKDLTGGDSLDSNIQLVFNNARLGAAADCRDWDSAAEWGRLSASVTVHKGEAIFPRIDMEKALAELEAIQEAQKKAALPALEIEPLTEEKVDFDTFCRSDFRVVKVKACEAVKKSDKLLRFTLDDGTGTDRQILSGIHKWYEPEQLVGKTLVAIVNLPPRKMMGLESCGMLLSATHTEKGQEVLNLIMVDDKIPAGAKLC